MTPHQVECSDYFAVTGEDNVSSEKASDEELMSPEKQISPEWKEDADYKMKKLMFDFNVRSLMVVDLCVLVLMEHHNQRCSSLRKQYLYLKALELNNIDMVLLEQEVAI
ncbi:unnamed protein product [Lactuca virosa]|uniref:Uncharacterized protein n=1 Tax=Lactuca virosa TaxID=75947 RepID=A0AAU9N372_9ASTR|nr:unnamed protein product [Lactuca virosa]